MDEINSKILDQVLAYLPNYGDFRLMNAISKLEIISSTNSYKTIYHFLLDEGYATERKDLYNVIGADSDYILQLTERGRSLKECGSLNSYLQKRKKDHENEKFQRASTKYMLWVTLVIAITGVVSVFYYLIEIWKFFQTSPAYSE
jgi:hypothetical protein